MSYTPPTRPPIIPQIPPPIMPPYGYPPILPPPMMGVRPPLLPPGLPPIDPKKLLTEKSPSTTVFVGNISERVPDAMMRHMLQRCGNVLNWKRAQGANGKLQAFGFCEYDNPESTLRCIRLLNGYEIAEKKIIVKVDQKTRDLLSEHIKKTRLNNDKLQFTKNAKKAAQLRNQNPEDEKSDINLELADEDTLKEDRIVINSFEVILRQYAKDLIPPPPEPQTNLSETTSSTENIAINGSSKPSDQQKSPNNILDADKKHQEEKDKEKIKSSEKDKDNSQKASALHRYENERDTSRSPSESKTRSRRRTSPSFEERSRSGSRTRYGRNDDFYVQKENRTLPNQEESEEMKERKKLERKLREKEMAYRERLRSWESREQKKKHEYSIEKKNDSQRHKFIFKEAKKLKQFLEDYEDSKDDAAYFKGINLEKKLKLREKEIEMDTKDRQKEKEELEELKRKLIEKGNTNDPDLEAKRIQNDENLKLKKKYEKLIEESSSSSSEDEEDEQEEKDEVPSIINQISYNEINKSSNQSEATIEDRNYNIQEKPPNIEFVDDEKQNEEMIIEETVQEKKEIIINTELNLEKNLENFLEDENSMSQLTESPVKIDNSPGASNSPIFSGTIKNSIQSFNSNNILPTSVTIKALGLKKTIQPKNQIFADEEEEQGSVAKKARLPGMNSDERKKAVKKLVESIPTDRDELFAYPIDWEQLDHGLMEKRIKPWINKKIIEYIGEEEESLNDFICTKIKQQTKPERLLEEVKVVLDEEAELFIKKMWRLIVYETESKRCGLSK